MQIKDRNTGIDRIRNSFTKYSISLIKIDYERRELNTFFYYLH